jgi:xanthosine utilization system XapX-like protein
VTTSFVLAAHGRFGESLVNQPFGFAVFLLVAGGLGGLVFTLATARSWYPVFVRVNPVVIILALLGLLLASWAYKWSVM